MPLLDAALGSALIYGAGSIGNHLSHAARTLGWAVTVCDVDPHALRRMREEIYPGRYGRWDAGIRLALVADLGPGDVFDCVIIGTPPDSHMAVACEALARARKALLIEKPLATPSLAGCAALRERLDRFTGRAFVGYDHVVGAAAVRVVDLMRQGSVGEVKTIDVEFREHWGGIFNAHPWLAGPWDSYLGFSQRGGGASGEHSHALNLWQHLARAAGTGPVRGVSAACRWVRDGRVDYDEVCAMTLRTESGMIGRVIQDVVSVPVTKRAYIQGSAGRLEWVCGLEPGVDAVRVRTADGAVEEERITKTRPDDFLAELRAIQDCCGDGSAADGILIERGFDTQLVLAAALRSAETGRQVTVDYSRDYGLSALDTESST